MFKAAAAAAAFALAGCGEREYVDPEALAFGYKGLDLKSTNTMYLAVSAAETNWVPERVLSVFEKYDWAPEEKALLAAAGAPVPCEALAEFPAGYAKEAEGPWYSYWSRAAESFGEKGKTGAIAHFNREKNVWELGETYFSSYWKTREEAFEALGRLEKKIAEGFGPKKFHRFDAGWVAEFVRLCATGVAGQRADGTWTCMLNLRDKCNDGCGPWVGEEEQRERLDEYEYKVALAAWRKKRDGAAAENHAAVEKEMAAKGLAGFGGAGSAVPGYGGGFAEYVQGAESNATIQALWDEKTAGIEKMFGGKIKGEVARQASGEEGGEWWSAAWEGGLHEGRLDVASSPGSGGQAMWRIIAAEKTMPGCEVPPPPERKGAAKRKDGGAK